VLAEITRNDIQHKVAESERAIAALQTKIDAPDVIIVSKFVSPALAHDASVLQHVSTFCDGEC
jgi:hypothetical protein